MGGVELSLFVRPALTSPPPLIKENVRFGHFSSLGTWDVLCVFKTRCSAPGLAGGGMNEFLKVLLSVPAQSINHLCVLLL